MKIDEIRKIIIKNIENEIKNDSLNQYVIYCVDDADDIKKVDLAEYEDFVSFIKSVVFISRATFAIAYLKDAQYLLIAQYDKGAIFLSFCYDVVDSKLVLNDQMTLLQNSSINESFKKSSEKMKIFRLVFNGNFWN